MWGNASPNTSSDSFGHGTAVASVAAGTTYGVAKNAIIHSVRVTLDGYNVSTAAQVCGINWVASQGQRPAVANMSIGGVPSAFAIRDAINGVTAANITFVKAAGNDYVDAFQDRGNRANNEIVVGATDPTNDTFASFSDYGPTISILAPGVNVLVADRYNPGYAKYASGTSFAAPYVAGVAAAFLESSPDIWPGQVKNTMTSYATYYQIQSLPSGTTDALLNDLYIY